MVVSLENIYQWNLSHALHKKSRLFETLLKKSFAVRIALLIAAAIIVFYMCKRESNPLYCGIFLLFVEEKLETLCLN